MQMMKQHVAPKATRGSNAARVSSSVPVLPRRTAGAQRRSCILAAAPAEPKSALALFSDSIGLPTDDGIFGFTPFAEMWAGRWAQLGFASSIVAEFVTGRGTLQQVGLPSPNGYMLALLCVVFGGATLAGTIVTVSRATSKQMSRSEIDRYKSFLGLNKEDDYKQEAIEMKRRGDFTTPGNNQSAINEARASTPVDAFLSTNEIAEGQTEAQRMKASVSTVVLEKEGESSQGSSLEQMQAAASREAAEAQAAQAREASARRYEETMYFGQEGELAYARNIEITNGRWAMVGFLAAILVEASTGQGIIGQCITYLKMSGLLGADSGF